jgi:hypothetical protein
MVKKKQLLDVKNISAQCINNKFLIKNGRVKTRYKNKISGDVYDG